MDKITFENLPQAVNDLSNKFDKFEELLIKLINNSKPTLDIWFDLEQVLDYDPERRKKSTWYFYTSKGLVPFHRRGKKNLFLKSEIDEWLKQGRRKTIEEIKLAGDNYLNSKK